MKRPLANKRPIGPLFSFNQIREQQLNFEQKYRNAYIRTKDVVVDEIARKVDELTAEEAEREFNQAQDNFFKIVEGPNFCSRFAEQNVDFDFTLAQLIFNGKARAEQSIGEFNNQQVRETHSLVSDIMASWREFSKAVIKEEGCVPQQVAEASSKGIDLGMAAVQNEIDNASNLNEVNV